MAKGTRGKVRGSPEAPEFYNVEVGRNGFVTVARQHLELVTLTGSPGESC